MNRKELLKKYMDGRLSEEEFEMLMNDINQAKDATAYEQTLEQRWKEAERSPLPSQMSYRMLNDFKQKLSAQAPRKQRTMQPFWYSAAAVVTLFVTGVALWWTLGQAQTIEYTTGYGETRTLTLPDNSTVVLNANSSLTYRENWDTEQPREVWLDGEAFFSVVHTQNHQRFQVNVNEELKVEVLGTEFNVKDRREKTQVVLNNGKVKLDINSPDKAQTVTMQPGDLVEFSGAGKPLVKKQVNPELYAAWRHQKMMFEQMPLNEIAKILEDNYGVSITIEDSILANTRLSGAFPIQNLEMILTSLPTIVDMEVERNKDKIIFKPQ